MNGYLYMAMTNYPEPASFLEPMPAWPVDESVKPWKDIPTAAEWVQAQSKTPSSVKSKDSFVWAMVRSTLGLLGKNSEKKVQATEGLSDRNKQLLQALQDSTSVYFNYTGAYPCTNLSDWEGTGSLDGFGWNVLACN